MENATIVWSTIVTNYLTLLFVVDFIIALTIIFLERKNPSATLAWIMVLFLLPVMGIVFYFMFSQNISRQKMFKLSKSEEAVMENALQEQIEEIKTGSFNFSNRESRAWRDLIRLNQTYGKAFFTQDNKISVITDGEDMHYTLLEDIKSAKSTINIMYFIIKNDNIGKQILKALTERAQAGVEVRLLIDAIGGRQILDFTIAELREAGGRVAFFFPPKFKYLKMVNMKLNYRNHRKIVVIDGAIGYIGGFNIGREYVGLKKKFGYWRDTHLRFVGSGVQDINARFIMDWKFAAKERLTVSEVYYSEVVKEGTTGIQIVSSGPDSAREEIKRAYMRMIASATKNIYLQTPYFVPDDSLLDSLKMAALSGVDVKIMIPCMPDHMFVYWATYSYVGELINSGIKIYIYDNGFLHAKTIVVDTEVASIGSANFDRRSFKLNFEANAFIYDGKEAKKIEAIFEQDMKLCHELTKELYQKRSIIIKFKEAISRLLSDLL
ncbi:MAG: cardiolipin synthase [Peptostreptococcaceae bacterium]|nr:cardiolipin synthase [Peptostreptococcaceae bacterium]